MAATPTPDFASAASGQTIYAGMVRPSMYGSGLQDGDSLTSFAYPSDPSRAGLPLARNLPKILRNFGTPNETLSDMLARQSTTLSYASAVGGKWIVFRGGTNGGTATDYATYVDACIAAGLFVFCEQIPPKSGADFTSMNASIASICAARPSTAMYVQDGDAIATTGYQPVSGRTSDGIHMNNVGAFEMGVAQAPFYTPFFTDDQRLTQGGQVASQWINNPLMTGTSGGLSGGTGTVPTDWGVSADGVGTAFVASIVSADGGDAVQMPWLRVQLTAAGDAGHVIYVSANMTHPSIAADVSTYRTVDCVAEVRLSGLDTTNIDYVQWGPAASATYIQPTPKFPLSGNGTITKTPVLRSGYERLSPASHSANTLQGVLTIGLAGSFASPAGYIDIRCASAIGAN